MENREWIGEITGIVSLLLFVVTVIMTVHAHFTEDRNIFLYASLLVTVWLTFAGILMRSKQFTSDTKKQMRLIHMS